MTREEALRQPIEFTCNGCKAHKGPLTYWKSNPGRQSEALNRSEKEILYGGSRGGGKSAAGIAWLALGNPLLAGDHPLRATYLNHPRYQALVLRRNAIDLAEWIERAADFFGHFGVTYTKQPAVLKFKTGATIYLGHLDDDSAFEKYKGWELHKVLIEELTLIPKQAHYLKVLGSCRSTIDGIRSQLFLTTNPDGPGAAWVKRRFIQFPGRTRQETDGRTLRDTISGLTRVFIPAKLTDNPVLERDPEYRQMLMAQDEVTRRQWIDGDWDVTSDQFFRTFRPEGPRYGDPCYCKTCAKDFAFGKEPHPEHEWETNARHVIPVGSVHLSPWWTRAIGVDWGYRHNTAVYGVALNQNDGRFHVYREFVRNQMDSEEIGAEIAKRWMDDLYGLEDRHIPIYLSHDAFQVEDATRTRAERIKSGIQRILGPDSVFLVAPNEDEREMGTEDRHKSIMDRYSKLAGKAVITINRARRDRVDGWQYIRDLLRFIPTVSAKFDKEYARSLLALDNGIRKYEEYKSKFENRKPEILPGLVIWDSCPKLIQQMKDAVNATQKGKPEDVLEDGAEHSNDCLDALRYVLLGMSDAQNREPLGVFVRKRLERFEQTRPNTDDPHVRIQVTQKAIEDYRGEHRAGTGTVIRRASHHARRF